MDIRKLFNVGECNHERADDRTVESVSAKITYELANNKQISGDRESLEPGYESIVARKINDSKFRDALTYVSAVMLELFPRQVSEEAKEAVA